MPPKKVNKRDRKEKTLKKLYELLGKHKQIVVVTLENVGSLQVQQIRKDLAQHNGTLVIGKNTVIRKAIQLRMKELPEGEEWDWAREMGSPIPELESFLGLLKGKVGFVFSDEPIFEMKPRIESNKVPAAARVGILAPNDVVIPPGPTGMDPGQISFFHALNVSTKIQKGQIEITKDYKVCEEGRKVTQSEVALLGKMGIMPFSYNMHVISAYDNGAILGQEVISLSPDDILGKFQQGVKNITALSLESGIPTELSVPHLISNCFKNLASIGLEIDYTFKQLANASASSGPAQTQAEVKDDKKANEPAPAEEEPEEEDVDMGGLFD